MKRDIARRRSDGQEGYIKDRLDNVVMFVPYNSGHEELHWADELEYIRPGKVNGFGEIV